MLQEFHETFDVDVSIGKMDDKERMRLRLDLLVEELNEYLIAQKNEDEAAFADAIGDIVYVLAGTAIALWDGQFFDELMEEVHCSNMSKLDERGLPIKRPDGKILKGPNYSEPDIELLLSRFQKRATPPPGEDGEVLGERRP
jgi:predicted HAD superfamily Cof-like phosphohydrolase